ncbi:MAG: hypothetical protein ABJK11_09650 [Balneola sp.]
MPNRILDGGLSVRQTNNVIFSELIFVFAKTVRVDLTGSQWMTFLAEGDVPCYSSQQPLSMVSFDEVELIKQANFILV